MSTIVFDGDAANRSPNSKYIRRDKLIELLQELPENSYFSPLSTTGNLGVFTASGFVQKSYSRDEDAPFEQTGYIDLNSDRYEPFEDPQ